MYAYNKSNVNTLIRTQVFFFKSATRLENLKPHTAQVNLPNLTLIYGMGQESFVTRGGVK